jgi:hypothetical protein
MPKNTNETGAIESIETAIRVLESHAIEAGDADLAGMARQALEGNPDALCRVRVILAMAETAAGANARQAAAGATAAAQHEVLAATEAVLREHADRIEALERALDGMVPAPAPVPSPAGGPKILPAARGSLIVAGILDVRVARRRLGVEWDAHDDHANNPCCLCGGRADPESTHGLFCTAGGLDHAIELSAADGPEAASPGYMGRQPLHDDCAARLHGLLEQTFEGSAELFIETDPDAAEAPIPGDRTDFPTERAYIEARRSRIARCDCGGPEDGTDHSPDCGHLRSLDELSDEWRDARDEALRDRAEKLLARIDLTRAEVVDGHESGLWVDVAFPFGSDEVRVRAGLADMDVETATVAGPRKLNGRVWAVGDSLDAWLPTPLRALVIDDVLDHVNERAIDLWWAHRAEMTKGGAQ